MCTAISYTTKDHYFGRNLDLEYSYREEVTIVPRNYPFRFRRAGERKRHYALIGMAYVQDGYPLYYDAVNEKGLGMAGLNFPGNAVYSTAQEGKENVSPFEFIPYLLGSCATLSEARKALERVLLVDIPFSKELPLTPLHWMIADGSGSLVVEQTAEGLRVYDDPVGVMTNNPPFPVQMTMLANYMQLSPKQAENRFAPSVPIEAYSRGMGAVGLPGDMSSFSRFVKAAFVKSNSVAGEGEKESVNQFFHLLSSVEQPRGSVLWNGHYEITVYSSCCNATKGIYYYTTYENRAINGISLFREDLEGTELIRYPLLQEELRIGN